MQPHILRGWGWLLRQIIPLPGRIVSHAVLPVNPGIRDRTPLHRVFLLVACRGCRVSGKEHYPPNEAYDSSGEATRRSNSLEERILSPPPTPNTMRMPSFRHVSTSRHSASERTSPPFGEHAGAEHFSVRQTLRSSSMAMTARSTQRRKAETISNRSRSFMKGTEPFNATCRSLFTTTIRVWPSCAADSM